MKYTEEQLKHAFECGANVREEFFHRKRPFDLEFHYKYFKEKVMIRYCSCKSPKFNGDHMDPICNNCKRPME